MYLEVLECENIHTTQLPPKLLDNNLTSVKSQESLNLTNNNKNSISSTNGSQTNLEHLFNSDNPTRNHHDRSSSPKSIKSLTFLSSNTETTNTTSNNNTKTAIYTSQYGKTLNTTNNSNNNDNFSDCWSIYSDTRRVG